MKRALLMLLLLLITTGCSGSSAQQATVTSVTDGDTFDVRIGSRTDTVRVLGIDTPETHAKNKQQEYGSITDTACLRRWGERAGDQARAMLENETVMLVFGPERRGYYDRLLAYVHIHGQDMGEVLLEEGLARVYNESDFGRKEKYLKIQQEARASERGLWGCG